MVKDFFQSLGHTNLTMLFPKKIVLVPNSEINISHFHPNLECLRLASESTLQDDLHIMDLLVAFKIIQSSGVFEQIRKKKKTKKLQNSSVCVYTQKRNSDMEFLCIPTQKFQTSPMRVYMRKNVIVGLGFSWYLRRNSKPCLCAYLWC